MEYNKYGNQDFDRFCIRYLKRGGREPRYRDDTIAKNYIKDSYVSIGMDSVDRLPYYVIGSTIGTHLGPGVVGIAFFEK